MTEKYSIYNNDTTKPLFKSDNIFEVNNFIRYNLEPSELMYLYKRENMIIMYFGTYTIYMKIMQ